MSHYAAAHANPNGPGDSRPTALDIIRDERLIGKLAGKVIVITGVTSGIGYETARALSATGATLFLTARNLEKAKKAVAGLLERDRVSLIEMDNNSFKSIRTATTDILAASKNQVNVLINNAGVMGIPQLELTEDGHEVHWQTNYLSEFLLFQLLKPALIASASPEFHSRVVNVGSSAHRAAVLSSRDNYDFQNGGYHFAVAYRVSKLAATYLANFIDRRYGPKGVHATSLHPGGISTNISRHVSQEFVDQILSNPLIAKVLKSPEQGAATTVIAAVGSDWEGRGGRYLEDCAEAQRGRDDNEEFGIGYVSQTYDVKEEERLWTDSLQICGLMDDDA